MSIRRVFNGSAPVLAVLPALLCSVFAHAQTVHEKSLPGVVVTGTRFEQRLADDPVRTSVVTADDIARSGARTLIDVLGQQTGIQLIDNSGNPNRQVDLRGFGMTGDQNTLILLDGQRITENELASADLASIPLDSIDRIEILRGSGSVMYGRGATGGTINIITKRRPNAAATATAGLTVGGYGTLGASVGATVSKEKISLSVFADKNDTDNYRRNNRSEQQNVTALLSYQGERGPISLRLSSGQQSLRLPGERSAQQLLTDPRGATTPNNSSSLDSLRAALSTEQKFGFGYLAIDLTHRIREAKSLFLDYGYLAPDLTKATASSASPRVRIPFSTAGINHSLVIGADWEQWNWDYFSTDTAPSPSSNVEQANKALYVRNAMSFFTGTSIALGAREQHSETDARFSGSASQRRKLHAYEVALRQDVGPKISIFARTGSSFRLQNVDELRPPFLSTTPTLLEPQTARDLDIGMNYSAERFSGSLTLFRIRLENEIMFHPSAANNINLPPTERRGVELDGRWKASSVWSLESRYTFTDARFLSGTVGGQPVAGKEVPLVPAHRASLAAVWDVTGGTSLTLRATYSGEARLDNDQQNTSSQRRPSFVVTDMVGLHKAGDWRFRASLLNLTNERYFTYGILSGGSYSAYPAPGRTVMLTAERRF